MSNTVLLLCKPIILDTFAYLIFSKNNIIFENRSIVVTMARKVFGAEESTDSRKSQSCGSVDAEDLGMRPSAVDEAQVQLVLPPWNVVTVNCLTLFNIHHVKN